jgi:hypothetical protein
LSDYQPADNPADGVISRANAFASGKAGFTHKFIATLPNGERHRNQGPVVEHAVAIPGLSITTLAIEDEMQFYL